MSRGEARRDAEPGQARLAPGCAGCSGATAMEPARGEARSRFSLSPPLRLLVGKRRDCEGG
eukprot:10593162-Alexandrium_andersonii.AAC.1